MNVMAGQILVTGSGGAQFSVDPELPWVAAQLATGQLVPVSHGADTGTAGGESDTVGSPPARPGNTASKADWVAYIVATTELSEAAAEDLTKRELIDRADSA